MSLFSDLFGGNTKTTTVQTPTSQLADMEATQQFRNKVAMPYFQKGMTDLDTMYGRNEPGMLKAGQNVAGIAGQVQETTGGVGESALRSGTNFYQSLFNPQYEQQQIQAALIPAQMQYRQNIRQSGLNAMRGGTAGSSRQAMLNRMSADAARAQQAQLTAQVGGRVRGEQMQGAGQLANIGYSGLDRALAAAQAKQAAAENPMNNFYKYLAAKPQTVPGTLLNAPYPGTQGSSSQETPSIGSIISKVAPFFL